jgi:hypothetical protein
MDRETEQIIEKMKACLAKAHEQAQFCRDKGLASDEKYWLGYEAGIRLTLSLLGVYLD